MLKRFIKYMNSLLVVAVMISCLIVPISAKNGLSISSSASKVSAGGTFTVTVKAGSNYFVENLKLSVTGGTIVTNINTKTLDKSETATAKIKLTGDSCTVKVTGTSVNYDNDDQELSASASVTVTKKTTSTNTNTGTTKPTTPTKPTVTKSSDASLSSLSVNAGTLSPAFNKNTLEYNVQLPADASKITLAAKANHAKATVSGTGEKELKVGNNVFNVVCKAENGTEKTYKINVFVDDTPLIYTTYNDQKLGVVRNITSENAPATFEETKITLEGQEVIAYHSNQYNQTIVYLVDEQGNKNYYIYEENKGITSIFRFETILGRNIVIFDLTDEEKVRENMVYQEVTIDGVTLNGFKYEQPGYENYTHILVMNEMGEKVVYQHESSENSLQLYKEYVEEEIVEEEKSFDDYYFYGACGCAGFFALTTLFMIFKHQRFKKKGIQKIKDYYENRNR